MTKDELHSVAQAAWYAAGKRGLIAMGTGTGKSKLALNIISNLYALNPKLKVFLGVPTEGLRDKNWPEEAEKWGVTEMYQTCVQGTCYAAMAKYTASDFNLIILDEGHHLTLANSGFFASDPNHLIPVLILTATEPDENGNERDRAKAELLRELEIKTVFHYSLDEGVQDQNIADYIIYLVPCPLDSKVKYIKAGSKVKSFKTTEEAAYKYLQKRIKTTHIQIIKDETPDLMSDDLSFFITSPKRGLLKRLEGERMGLLYNLQSKAAIASKIIKRFTEKMRILVFCGSIEQSIQLVGADNVFNSKSNDKAFNSFKKMTSRILGVVNAVNEGHTIDELDIAIIVQINSNERDLVQRIGRVVRFRDGHKARIFLLYSPGTQDEKWMRSAIRNFDQTKIQELKASSI